MVSGAFKWEQDKPHYVIMILDKVDPVYVGEAKNAFSRYNKEKFAARNISINKDALDQNRTLLVFDVFDKPEDAMTYYENIKKAAPIEISWLPANKYSFLVISGNNLQLLKTNKDISSYKTLLNNLYPGKF